MMIHSRFLEKEGKEKKDFQPNLQRTLNKLLSELQCRHFVSKHQLSMQFGAKMCKKTCVRCATELPFCVPPLVVGKSLFGLIIVSPQVFLDSVLVRLKKKGCTMPNSVRRHKKKNKKTKKQREPHSLPDAVAVRAALPPAGRI